MVEPSHRAGILCSHRASVAPDSFPDRNHHCPCVSCSDFFCKTYYLVSSAIVVFKYFPIASLINVTERRAWIVNVASQKMLPKSGNLFEFHLHDIV